MLLKMAGSLSFLMAGQCSIVYTYHVFFIRSFVYEHFFLSYLFIYFWLCWVADVGFLWLGWTRATLTRGAPASLRGPLLLRSTGIRHVGFLDAV